MSTKDQEAFLRSQLATVEQFLADTPADDFIERPGLEYRRTELRAELDALTAAPRVEPASVELTFRGGPVVGSHGIEASFAAKILSTFRNTVSAITADLQGRLTSDRGRLPTTDRMLVTGCVLGSFGFRLEEAVDRDVISSVDRGPSIVAQSLRQAKAILAGCATSDEALADALGEASDRVLTPIKEFLTCLRNADATCTLALSDGRFQLQNAEEIEQALDRATAGAEEHLRSFSGVVYLLPSTRRFELRQADDQVISGRIDRLIVDPEQLAPLQGRTCTAQILVRMVGRVRQARRYVLRSLEAQA